MQHFSQVKINTLGNENEIHKTTKQSKEKIIILRKYQKTRLYTQKPTEIQLQKIFNDTNHLTYCKNSERSLSFVTSTYIVGMVLSF
jgi:hypothetical protein